MKKKLEKEIQIQNNAQEIGIQDTSKEIGIQDNAKEKLEGFAITEKVNSLSAGREELVAEKAPQGPDEVLCNSNGQRPPDEIL